MILNNMRKINISVIILLFTFNYIEAQQPVKLKGTILEESSGKALQGAIIIVKGTINGAISDIEGNFSLEVKQQFPIRLIASFIGYKNKEVVLSQTEPVNISLAVDVNGLSEVVVIGYGTQKRNELTGSIASVPKVALKQTSTSVDKLMSGTIAGVNITQSSGQPGSAPSVRIRGGNSVYAKNDPLYVIDGFIFYSDNSSTKAGLSGIDGNLNPLSGINPGDIESIEVLKDVSATAIYGSRGANGVIIITTKKGKRGGNSFSYRYNTGLDKSIKKLDLLSASEWARIQKDYFNNKGGYTDEEIVRLGEGIDWQDAVLKTGLYQTHELSVSGGDQTRYHLSANYTDQPGIIINSGFERFSGRLNLDSDPFSNLTIGLISTADMSTQNSLTTFEDVNYNDSPYSHGITNSLTYALYIPPVVPVYNSDGSYNYHNPYEYDYLTYYGQTANPVSDLNNSKGETIKFSLLGSFFARYTLKKGLVARVNTGTNVSYVTQNFYAPSYTAVGLEKAGVGGIGNRRTIISQMESTLSYSKKINESNYIDLLAGYTFQNTKTNYSINLTSHLLNFKNLAAGSNPYPPSSNASGSEIRSLLWRINYTFLERYNLTATMRGDNSSRFASGNRWGYFPSVGLSWNINKESFVKSLYPSLSSLKLRVTFGSVGNSEIGDYEYSQFFTASIYNGEVAYNVSNPGNDNLKWETTTQYNAGIDAGLFKDKLKFAGDIYYKETTDLLLKTPVDPWNSAAESQLVNLGNVTNKGVELAAIAEILELEKLTLTVSANIARNINTITNMGNFSELTSGRNQEEILRIGESLGSFYGLIFNGVVQSGEDGSMLSSVNGRSPLPGDIRFVDVTKDGKIDNNDRVVLGSIQPDFTYGFSSTFSYKGIDLYISLQGSEGNEVYNLLRRYLERPNDSYNMSAVLLNSWTEENPSNTIPGINSPLYSWLDSRYVEDASYVKIKNITIGYNLPLKSRKLPLNFRISASVQNLYTLTRYKGYDPEVGGGIDLGIYPSSRDILLGAGINF